MAVVLRLLGVTRDERREHDQRQDDPRNRSSDRMHVLSRGCRERAKYSRTDGEGARHWRDVAS